MNNFSDEEIIRELMRRLMEKDRALHDLRVLTKKLEGLNAKLLESEKVKSHFLSNIRNEINNPLTSVLTMCEILNPPANDGAALDAETLRLAIDTIHRESFNLNFQLRNIFAAAELEAGEAQPRPSSVDIGSLLKSAADSFRQRAAEKNVSIRLDVSEELTGAPFRTDSEKLERIIANLLSNAIEFNSPGGSVEIRASREDGGLAVSVKDQGMGIGRSEQEAIFERFRQLETGSTKSHGGHGLGLSITKAALDMLGGSISVRSDKGEGAEFIVRLPEAEGTTDAFSLDGNEFFFEAGAGERF